MAWSEGIDVGSDQGIKMVVERAGLDWAAASEVIDNTDWEGPMEENRLQMLASGLWGCRATVCLTIRVGKFFLLGARSHLAFGA